VEVKAEGATTAAGAEGATTATGVTTTGACAVAVAFEVVETGDAEADATTLGNVTLCATVVAELVAG